MPWDGKRKVKPLEVSKCCCGECGGVCPDPPAQALVRCEACHYGERHGTGLEGTLSWYCAGSGHGGPVCATNEEHRVKVAAQTAGIKDMLRVLDHSMEVGAEAKWGQTTLTSLAEERA